MKFNFFVLIACLMIHFIAQAGNAKKLNRSETVAPKSAQVPVERTVASGDQKCDCEKK